MYSSNTNDFDALLIPKVFNGFNNDFNDIIECKINKAGLHFSILKKNNHFVEIINYDFITDENKYSVGNYFYSNFTDDNNRLQKDFINSNCSLQKYLSSSNIRTLFFEGYKINRIKRNKNETKLNKIRGNSLLEAFETFDKHFDVFNNIEDHNTPILKLLEDSFKIKIK
jgi:hypothetical protein